MIHLDSNAIDMACYSTLGLCLAVCLPIEVQVLNAFMCTGLTRDTNQYFSKPSPVRKGDYIEFLGEGMCRRDIGQQLGSRTQLTHLLPMFDSIMPAMVCLYTGSLSSVGSFVAEASSEERLWPLAGRARPARSNKVRTAGPACGPAEPRSAAAAALPSTQLLFINIHSQHTSNVTSSPVSDQCCVWLLLHTAVALCCCS